jgi:peptide deformylase
MVIVQRFDKEGFPFETYINPVIVKYSEEKQPCPEGCLSIPNKQATTQNRSKSIDIEYMTLEGELKNETVSSFTAVVFQHEIDHLNGILFIDHLEKELKK